MTFYPLLWLFGGVGAAATLALLGGVAPSGAATVSATRSGASSSRPSAAGDGAIAGDARLRLSDLPRGWTASARPSTKTLNGCPGLDAAKAAVSARMNSPEFRTARATAQSATYVYSHGGDAAHWFGRLTDAGTERCFAVRLRRSLASTLRAERIHVDVRTSRLPWPPLGDNRAAERVFVRLSRSGATASADVDFIFVRVDRGIAILVVGEVGTPFDPTLERQLAVTLTHRLAADLGRPA